MKDQGIGVLLITHDIHAALEVADRIGIFYSGYVIEIALKEDFSGDGENLLHPYTKSLFKALPTNGFEVINDHAVEGSVWIVPTLDAKWKDSDSRKRLLDIIHAAEHEESMMGMSPHFLVIGRK